VNESPLFGTSNQFSRYFNKNEPSPSDFWAAQLDFIGICLDLSLRPVGNAASLKEFIALR
jgi:hypothetical protein